MTRCGFPNSFSHSCKVLNANFLAKRIGINLTLLSQYVSGKKRPSSEQTDKIVQGIQSIGQELAELNLT